MLIRMKNERGETIKSVYFLYYFNKVLDLFRTERDKVTRIYICQCQN